MTKLNNFFVRSFSFLSYNLPITFHFRFRFLFSFSRLLWIFFFFSKIILSPTISALLSSLLLVLFSARHRLLKKSKSYSTLRIDSINVFLGGKTEMKKRGLYLGRSCCVFLFLVFLTQKISVDVNFTPPLAKAGRRQWHHG